MSIPTPTCVEVPPPPSPLSVRLPGGITLKSVPITTGVVLTDLANVQGMIAALSPALAALQPIFILIDSVISVKDTIEAIPGLIGGDVPSFTSALGRLASNIGKLVGMTPQLSLPVLLLDSINTLKQALGAVSSILDNVVAAAQDADAVIAMAEASVPPNAALKAQGECAAAQAASMLNHAVASLGPMSSLMGTLGLLGAMLPGFPGMPSLGDMTGKSASEVQEALSAVVEALDAIQVPGV